MTPGLRKFGFTAHIILSFGCVAQAQSDQATLNLTA